LNSVAAKVNDTKSQDAYVYAIVAVATVKLELQDLTGSRADLDNAEKILDHFDSVETIVHAAFYRVNANYYQVSPVKFMAHQAYQLIHGIRQN
jgi:26S proteasome regulatory subunit N9